MFRIISAVLALIYLAMFGWGCQQERPALVENFMPETNSTDYAVVLQSPNATYYYLNGYAPISVSIIRDVKKTSTVCLFST